MKLFVCRTEQTNVVRDGRRFANAHQFVEWAVKVANHDRSSQTEMIIHGAEHIHCIVYLRNLSLRGNAGLGLRAGCCAKRTSYIVYHSTSTIDFRSPS
jgi:hypothetical protein